MVPPAAGRNPTGGIGRERRQCRPCEQAGCSMSGLHRWERALGIAAAVLFVGAVLGFGAALPLFDPIGHPVALLGAMGVPHALAFNIVGFALPGLLASLVALRLLLRVPRTAPWSMRVGAQLLMLAGVGFTAMGVLPLDTSDLDNPASQYHASAWMVWVLAFVPGAVMSGSARCGCRRGGPWVRCTWPAGWVCCCRPSRCRCCCLRRWPSGWPSVCGWSGWSRCCRWPRARAAPERGSPAAAPRHRAGTRAVR